jgi:hypothetical protein
MKTKLVSRHDTGDWCFLRDDHAPLASWGRGVKVDLRLVFHEELRAQVQERGSVLQLVLRKQNQQGKLSVGAWSLLCRQPKFQPTCAAGDSKPGGYQALPTARRANHHVKLLLQRQGDHGERVLRGE